MTFPGWASVAGAFGLVALLFGIVMLLDELEQQSTAEDFLATGVQTVTDQVEVDVHSTNRSTYISTVVVTYASSPVTLINTFDDVESNPPGRHAPDPGTRYAAPLAIVYDPEDPTRAMAQADADLYAAGPDSFPGALITIGGTMTIATAAGLILYTRRTTRLAHVPITPEADA